MAFVRFWHLFHLPPICNRFRLLIGPLQCCNLYVVEGNSGRHLDVSQQICSQYSQQRLYPNPPTSFFKGVVWPVTPPLDISWRLFLFFRLLLLCVSLLIGNVYPNPRPRPPLSYSVIVWNCNGLRSSATELSNFLAISTLNSDHLPVALTLDNDTPTARISRSFTNYRKASWSEFKHETERHLANLPLHTSCSVVEKEWRRVLQKASAHHVPSGYYRNYTPGLNAESARLVRERDEKRFQDPDDPSLPELNHQVAASIAAASRKRWMETVVDADRKQNPRRNWNLLKSLSGKRGSKRSPNQPISFKGRVYTKPRGIAYQFLKQYANVKVVKSTKKNRAI